MGERKLLALLKEMVLKHKGNYGEDVNTGGLIILWPILLAGFIWSFWIEDGKYTLSLLLILLVDSAIVFVLAKRYEKKHYSKIIKREPGE